MDSLMIRPEGASTAEREHVGTSRGGQENKEKQKLDYTVVSAIPMNVINRFLT